jgi:hypothetical protein
MFKWIDKTINDCPYPALKYYMKLYWDSLKNPFFYIFMFAVCIVLNLMEKL